MAKPMPSKNLRIQGVIKPSDMIERKNKLWKATIK